MTITIAQWKEKIQKSGLKSGNSSAFSYVDAHNADTSLEDIKNLAIALKENNQITQLNLLCLNMGDQGVKILAKALENHPTIVRITLLQNQIGPQGARALATLIANSPRLVEITLSNNHIGNEGAKIIASALEQNTTLHSIQLHNNNITDEGANAFIAVLEKNPTVTELDLKDRLKLGPHFKIRPNEISDKVLAALETAVNKNKALADEALNAEIQAKGLAKAKVEIELIRARCKNAARVQNNPEPVIPAEYSKPNKIGAYIGVGIVAVVSVVLLALGSIISMVIGGALLLGAVLTLKKALEVKETDNTEVRRNSAPKILSDLIPSKEFSVKSNLSQAKAWVASNTVETQVVGCVSTDNPRASMKF